MPYHNNELENIDFKAIDFYINELKNSGINCDNIKVFDEDDFYTIYLADKRDYEKRDIINKVSYTTHIKFEDTLYKTIQCEYFYDWFKNDKEVNESIDSGKIIDITNRFIKNTNSYYIKYNKETIIILEKMIKLLYLIFCNQKSFDILLDSIEKQNKKFAFTNTVNTISSVNTINTSKKEEYNYYGEDISIAA